MPVNDYDLLQRLALVHHELRRAREKLLGGQYWTARVRLGETFGLHIELRPHEECLTVGTSIKLAENVERAQEALTTATQAVMVGDIPQALAIIEAELP